MTSVTLSITDGTPIACYERHTPVTSVTLLRLVNVKEPLETNVTLSFFLLSTFPINFHSTTLNYFSTTFSFHLPNSSPINTHQTFLHSPQTILSYQIHFFFFPNHPFKIHHNGGKSEFRKYHLPIRR